MLKADIAGVALILAFATAATADQTVRLERGDRVSIRNAWGTTRVSPSATSSLTVAGTATVQRSADDPHLVIVSTRSSETSRVDLSVRIPAAVPLRVSADTGHIFIDRHGANVEVETRRANLTAKGIAGNVIVNTGNGNITLDAIDGLVDVTTGNGNTYVSNVRYGVHVVSINGTTEILCAGGPVAVKDTSGRVTVTNASDGVDLFTALGNATYRGPLAGDRSYRLKTLGGAIALHYAGATGFSAAITTESGKVAIDRSLETVRRTPRRTDVTLGDGSARVVLDSFDGRIALQRLNGEPIACGPAPR